MTVNGILVSALALGLLLGEPQDGKSSDASWTHGPPSDPGFFPLAVWLQDVRNAPKYKEAGLNTYVALWRGPTQEQVDVLKGQGMKLVCHQNEFGLAHKDDSTIIAWMHGDEPDNAQERKGGGYGPPVATEKIIADYKKIHDADPSRPVLLNLGQGVAWDRYVGRGVRTNHPEDYAEYLKGSDIVSFDIYPVVHDSAEISGKLYKPAEGVERLRRWGEGKKIVWNCIEASRIDNEKTKATASQIRSEVWMSLIHGSTGLIYFVHQFKPKFSEASLLQDADLLAGVTAINRQIQSLAPALNSPTVPDGATVRTSVPESPVDVMVKRQGDSVWVFAAAMREKETTASFVVKGAKGSAEVLGESRTIPLKDGAFDDEFKPYQVHLYRVR
ncbi:MAG TPA: hypothetical protein VKW04_03550 [Planctomycetota bacterium]|nr:hypothetical protein [Planctomycetota bacterium]